VVNRSSAALLLLPLLCAGPGWAEPSLTIAGAPETVFDWTTERCETWDIPDTPARAWRDPDGEVHLLSGSERNRMASGPSLGRLIRDCRVLYEGAHDDDPAAYDDRVWIAAPYIEGEKLIGLAHAEFHGHLRRDLCPTGAYMACWWNAILELDAADWPRAGDAPPDRHLVATLPYRPAFETGRREGYFSPSNIIRRGDYLYVFIFAEAYGAQLRGACLIRRPVGGGPGDWRAWDGQAFQRQFADPFRDGIDDAAAHVCAPLAGIRSTISGVVEDRASGGYVAVTAGSLIDADGLRRNGIWWARSPDLVHWSRPRLLLEVPLLWRRDCEAPAVYAYPSLIDDDSPSANLDAVDAAFWLYVVQMPLGADCRVGPERDLIRFPVSLLP
jgi:hypothetical protein